MNIILEGPDHVGKSTLARMIREVTGWQIQPREGKPPTWEATLFKATRYLDLDGMIIDRHVIISQNVYNEGLGRDEPDIPGKLVDELYQQTNLFIYCRALRGIEGHQPSGGESAEHMRLLELNYRQLIEAYDRWAVLHANIIYHNYNQTERVCRMVKGLVG